MRLAFLIRSGATLAAITLLACIWDPIKTDYSISLQVPDSLAQMDTVRVIILTPARETVEVAWNKPLEHADSLRRLRPAKYRGEEAIVQVLAFRKGFRAYKIEAHHFGDGRPTEFTRYLFATMDVAVETTRVEVGHVNYGLTPTAAALAADSGWAYCVQFDWSGIDRSRIISARLRLLTFAFMEPWSDSNVNMTYKVNALKSGWSEGFGNTFWNKGGWRNGGETFLANYPFSPEVLTNSVDPIPATGISEADKLMFRRENLDPVATQVFSLLYQSSAGPSVLPKPSELTPIEIGVTDYVKNTPPEDTHGFVINAEGAPNARNKYAAFCTKELGDRTYGPELVIRY